VEDSGPGVPPSERTVIFDRFSRGREGGNRGADSGTGLGLALVDEHIRLHGGRVWVEDRPSVGGGARFVIELPAIPLPAAGSAPGDDAAGFTYGLDSGLDGEPDGEPGGNGHSGGVDNQHVDVVVGANTATTPTGSSPAPKRRWWGRRGRTPGSART